MTDYGDEDFPETDKSAVKLYAPDGRRWRKVSREGRNDVGFAGQQGGGGDAQ